MVLEYNWEGDKTPPRAAFADRYLPSLQDLDGKFISVEGDLDHWDMQLLVWKPASLIGIMDLMRKQIATTPHTQSPVTLVPRSSNKDRSELEWKFQDDLGRAWVGFASAQPAADDKEKFNMTVKLQRERR